MKRSVKLVIALTLAGFTVFGATQGYLAGKQPQRSGTLILNKLSAPASVRYDEFGVPHIQAQSEADMYRALGFVHAQDRLFQMEMSRRLARGELAEVFGASLIDTDRLFRVLRIRDWADRIATRMDMNSPANQALSAYLDGVNQYQETRPAPLEFSLLGIEKRPFTVADTISVSGYLAYSFAAAFKTEPVLTYVRDQLGPDYLKAFDLAWHPQGVLGNAADPAPATALALRPGTQPPGTQSADASPPVAPTPVALTPETWRGMAQLARLSSTAIQAAGLAQIEGSNAWVVAGARTQSGKPLLAGDPHIAFATPAVWYEAHLSAPGFELYGHYPALVPMALLGLNTQFAWSMTMFQNDDLDLIREKINPDNPTQAWQGDATKGRWVEFATTPSRIAVKNAAAVELNLRTGPHGPIINDAFPGMGSAVTQPIALWWALFEGDNNLLDAMYAMNRADTLEKARHAASLIHAPGLNLLWANAGGDIGWWAAAKLPLRPDGVNPAFILDAGKGEAVKAGWRPFSSNPQETNPARGYIISANQQPVAAVDIPGYYNLHDRAKRLNELLAEPGKRWTQENTKPLQLESGTGYGPRILAATLPLLRPQVTAPAETALLDLLAQWDGKHDLDGVAPTVFAQLLYEIAHSAMADELNAGGSDMFDALLQLRVLDRAIPRLLADAASPWWDERSTPARESREERLLFAWRATLSHLRTLLGPDSRQWTWGRVHTLTHGHPLGQLKPLDRFFNVGPFATPGGHETPNNYDLPIGPLPLAVTWGPSTRRIIDFATPERSVGINPVGQSGVPGDAHYADQARMHVTGQYRQHHLSEADVAAHTRSRLELRPQP